MRISIVRPTIGMVIVMTCVTMFHGSHLNLKKTSQQKKYRYLKMISSEAPAAPGC
jgi:hypothetical protein